MSDHTTKQKTEKQVSKANISDVVWEFMTSVKQVRKRSGEEQAFDAKKIHRCSSGAHRFWFETAKAGR